MSGHRGAGSVGSHRQAPVVGEPPPNRTIAQACDAWLASAGLVDAGALAKVEACWVEVVGPDVAAHVRPRALDDGQLVVGVDHPGWATETAFLAEEILRSLESCLGTPLVTRLKVTVAPSRRLD